MTIKAGRLVDAIGAVVTQVKVIRYHHILLQAVLLGIDLSESSCTIRPAPIVNSPEAT